MAQEMKPFQIAVLSIFGVLALVGVIIFATYSGLGGTRGPGTVVIWGTLPQEAFDTTLNELKSAEQGYDGIHYVEKDPATYDAELLNALASGQGPDLIVLTQADILSKEDKLTPIPFSKVSERSFRDTFLDESDLFITKNGILGLPLAVDPLVAYWNRSMLASSGVAQPPRYWDELYDYATKVTKHDQAGTVTQSAVGLGEAQNISHAADIFSALLLQSGDKIVARTDAGAAQAVFSDHAPDGSIPSEAALTFYTQFADPNKSVYSWNRSLPLSHDAFVAGQLGLYFGYASELFDIRTQNPNLNFDVAPFPQAHAAAKASSLTAGRMYALALPKAGKNSAGALAVAEALSSSAYEKMLADSLHIPPARRDLIQAGAGDAVGTVFYNAALIASGWLDPNPVRSAQIWQSMIEGVTTGRQRVSEAVSNAQGSLDVLLKSR